MNPFLYVSLVRLQRVYVKVISVSLFRLYSKNLNRKMSKRQDLSAKQKCDLLKSYDVLPKNSLRDAAAHLNVSHCTLNIVIYIYIHT